MTNPAWKRTERRIAALLGGRRVPVTGRQRGDVPDIAHDQLSIEVKHRASIPQWLCEAIEQAQASATPAQIPIAVIHQHGKPYADALVVMTLADFTETRQIILQVDTTGSPSGAGTLQGSGIRASLSPPRHRVATAVNRISTWCQRYFHDSEYGEWDVELLRDGTLKLTDKGTHWKAAYHLPRAQMMIMNRFGAS